MQCLRHMFEKQREQLARRDRVGGAAGDDSGVNEGGNEAAGARGVAGEGVDNDNNMRKAELDREEMRRSWQDVYIARRKRGRCW